MKLLAAIREAVNELPFEFEFEFDPLTALCIISARLLEGDWLVDTVSGDRRFCPADLDMAGLAAAAAAPYFHPKLKKGDAPEPPVPPLVRWQEHWSEVLKRDWDPYPPLITDAIKRTLVALLIEDGHQTWVASIRFDVSQAAVVRWALLRKPGIVVPIPPIGDRKASAQFLADTIAAWIHEKPDLTIAEFAERRKAHEDTLGKGGAWRMPWRSFPAVGMTAFPAARQV